MGKPWVENGVTYKTRGDEVISFVEKYCLNPKTEELLVLDSDQKEFINEFYLMEWDETSTSWLYVYKNALRGEPRGGGKSTLAAAISLFELSPLSFNKAPQVQLASASRGNTKYVYEPARQMVQLNPAFESEFDMYANKNEIWCDANRGKLEKLSADGKGQFGGEPIFIVRDELHTWITDKQITLSEALMTSLGKSLPNARSLTTSTAGSDKNTLLGRLYDQSIKDEALEEVKTGLRTLKDRENRFLFWWWEAPSDLPVDDSETWQTCNRSERKSAAQLKAIYNDPNTTQDEFRRQYLNQWTKASNAWFQVGVWRKLKSEAEIPEKGRIQIGVDGGWSDDCTAITWAYAPDEESPVVVRSHVWSVIEDYAFHTFVPGGTMDMELVEDYILTVLAPKYTITEIVYDPRFFDQTAKNLSKKGFAVPPFDRYGAQMNDATALFYRLVTTGGITHDGDEVLTDHVESTAAIKVESGWTVKKLKQSRKIDATMSTIMAIARAKADLTRRNASYVYRRKTAEDGTTQLQKA